MKRALSLERRLAGVRGRDADGPGDPDRRKRGLLIKTARRATIGDMTIVIERVAPVLPVPVGATRDE
jgi:hypothetical protein